MKMVVWPVVTVLGLVLLVLVAVIESDEEGHGEEGHGKEGHGYGHGHGHYKHREFSIIVSIFSVVFYPGIMLYCVNAKQINKQTDCTTTREDRNPCNILHLNTSVSCQNNRYTLIRLNHVIRG